MWLEGKGIKMIKCACNTKDCKIGIYFDQDHLWFVDKNGKETLMYLDPNTIVELIKKLKEVLVSMVDKETWPSFY